MDNILFENEHKAIGSFPYIELENSNFNYITHYHEELEMIYIESGDIIAHSGADEIILSKGDICFFMPGEIHGFKSSTQNNIYVLKLNMNAYVENFDFWKIRLKNNKISPNDSIYNNFKTLLDEILEEYHIKQMGYEFAIRHCKNKIIYTLLRNLEYKFIDTSKNIKLLNSLNGFLEKNFDKDITLDEVSRACHFSKYYFAHKLKEMTGMTFISFLTAFRLEKAVNLLKTTHMGITDIALKCGFSNLRSFNRTFKTAYNTTPSAYRKDIYSKFS